MSSSEVLDPPLARRAFDAREEEPRSLDPPPSPPWSGAVYEQASTPTRQTLVAWVVALSVVVAIVVGVVAFTDASPFAPSCGDDPDE